MDVDVSRKFEDLRFRYSSCRAYEKPRTGRYREWGMRNYAVTSLGEIEINDWQTRMEDLIHEAGEEELQDALREWVRETYPHNITKETEIRLLALKLHSSRIFNDPLWVDYLPFNEKFRPEVANVANTRTIRSTCRYCKPAPTGTVTKELFVSHPDALPCPKCGAWMPYVEVKELEKK